MKLSLNKVYKHYIYLFTFIGTICCSAALTYFCLLFSSSILHIHYQHFFSPTPIFELEKMDSNKPNYWLCVTFGNALNLCLRTHSGTDTGAQSTFQKKKKSLKITINNVSLQLVSHELSNWWGENTEQCHLISNPTKALLTSTFFPLICICLVFWIINSFRIWMQNLLARDQGFGNRSALVSICSPSNTSDSLGCMQVHVQSRRG